MWAETERGKRGVSSIVERVEAGLTARVCAESLGVPEMSKFKG